MAKKEKKEKKEDLSQLKELIDGMQEIVKTINDLSFRIEKLESVSKENTITIGSKEASATDTAPSTMIEYPVPLEYRQLINTVLNEKFGVKITPFADQPAFTLVIVVPEEYSTLSEEEKKICKVDLRSKVITYADGINGVRQWAELVFSSFKPEIRAKIKGA